MVNQTNAKHTDSPYERWQRAVEREEANDPRGAEIQYQAAVVAADMLPLEEYRRNFHDELTKHAANPRYQSSPGVDLNSLKRAYHELLMLPFLTRIRLAGFYADRGNWAEAREVCEQAFEIGIDPMVQSDKTAQEIERSMRQIYEELILMEAEAQSATPDKAPGLANMFKDGKKARSNNALTSTGSFIIRNTTSGMQPVRAQQQAQEIPGAIQPDDSADVGKSKYIQAGRALERSAQSLKLGSVELVDALFGVMEVFSKDLKASPQYGKITVVTTKPEFVDETRTLRKVIGGQQRIETETFRYYRCRASTAYWSLSMRAGESSIEVYLVPAREVLSLSEAEDDYRLKMRLVRAGNGEMWTLDGVPAYADEVRVMIRKIVREVAQRTIEFMEINPKDAMGSIEQGSSLVKTLSELTEQRLNLAEKIVYQQEQIQNRIARDLHDAVIADVLMIKRSLSDERRLTDHELTSVLDRIAHRLREVCQDLAPRDLRDWGLRTVIEDMMAGVIERTGADCELKCDESLPELVHEVQLHIYRIIQECFNNIEKYAQASKIEVTLRTEGPVLYVSVQDNGKGFDVNALARRKTVTGGMGIGSIGERVELIRCFYPAQFWIQSAHGQGTKTTLQIKLPVAGKPD